MLSLISKNREKHISRKVGPVECLKLPFITFFLLFFLANMSNCKQSESVTGTGVWPDATQRRLTCENITDEDYRTVKLMKNEIYARHGRAFKTPWIREYFESQPWYRVNPNFRETDLTPLEKENVLFLKSCEDALAKGRSCCSGGTGVWPAATKRQLTCDDVVGKDYRMVKLMKNEIYSRHGRAFKTAWIREYFESQAWYTVNPDFRDSDLLPLEKKNVAFLERCEDSLSRGEQCCH